MVTSVEGNAVVYAAVTDALRVVKAYSDGNIAVEELESGLDRVISTVYERGVTNAIAKIAEG